MTQDMQPGPRQTVDRCVHSKLGPGVAVYDNGPAFFRADSGECVPMKSIGLESAGVNGTRLRSIDTSDAYTTLAVTESGERHERMWSPLFGAGWLVSERGDEWANRFEPDVGAPFRFVWVQLQGRPWAGDEEPHWRTFTLRDGDQVSFRRGERPDERIVARALAAKAPPEKEEGAPPEDTGRAKARELEEDTQLLAVDNALDEWPGDEKGGLLGKRVTRLVDALVRVEALLDRYDDQPGKPYTTPERLERLLKARAA